MMPFAVRKTRRSEVPRCTLAFLITLSGPCVWPQSAAPVQSEPNQSWAGQRIVTLLGFGDYSALARREWTAQAGQAGRSRRKHRRRGGKRRRRSDMNQG
jgi:hypothetical protein